MWKVKVDKGKKLLDTLQLCIQNTIIAYVFSHDKNFLWQVGL